MTSVHHVCHDESMFVKKEKRSLLENEMNSLIASSSSGVIRTIDVTKAGLHRSILSDYVNKGILARVSRGIYIRTDVWEDDWLILQMRYGKAVFSHETALFLHGFSDRVPLRITVTIPRSYNSASLSKENVVIRKALPSLYDLGITEVVSPSNNKVRAYDLERTLCDMLRRPVPNMELLTPAFQRYAAFGGQNIPLLYDYARQLHVFSQVKHYMEILL